MPIVSFFEVSPEERSYLRTLRIPGHTIKLYPGRADEADAPIIRASDIVSTFIYSQIDRPFLARAGRLRMVATRSTGFDHIDLAGCRRAGIALANVPFYGENTVAEHTFALILALSRRVHQAHVRTIRGDFSFVGLEGFDLKGKTIGIIGTGHIGIHVARIAKGFGMHVVAFDIAPNPFLAEMIGFEYIPLYDLLGRSDVVTLHAPYTPETHHLINKQTIVKFKHGALLINTARGGLVDTEALAVALDKGILAGAGLDVLEGEELIKEERQILSIDFPADRLKTLLQNHILLNRENVVITPHIAFNSREAFRRIVDTTVENIRAFLAGRPQNLVLAPPKRRPERQPTKRPQRSRESSPTKAKHR